MRSGNPSLNINVFRDLPAVVGSEVMTVNGTVNKTAILLFLLIVSASWTWSSIFGLMVTLIWLYMEILRLLSKLRDRR